MTHISQRLGKSRREAVERINLFWLCLLDHFDQVREIGVIAQGECSVALITETAIWIDGPTGQNRGPLFAEIAEHRRVDDIRRTEQHFAASRIGFIAFIFWEALAELFIDFCELVL